MEYRDQVTEVGGAATPPTPLSLSGPKEQFMLKNCRLPSGLCSLSPRLGFGTKIRFPIFAKIVKYLAKSEMFESFKYILRTCFDNEKFSSLLLLFVNFLMKSRKKEIKKDRLFSQHSVSIQIS